MKQCLDVSLPELGGKLSPSCPSFCPETRCHAAGGGECLQSAASGECTKPRKSACPKSSMVERQAWGAGKGQPSVSACR